MPFSNFSALEKILGGAAIVLVGSWMIKGGDATYEYFTQDPELEPITKTIDVLTANQQILIESSTQNTQSLESLSRTRLRGEIATASKDIARIEAVPRVNRSPEDTQVLMVANRRLEAALKELTAIGGIPEEATATAEIPDALLPVPGELQ